MKRRLFRKNKYFWARARIAKYALLGLPTNYKMAPVQLESSQLWQIRYNKMYFPTLLQNYIWLLITFNKMKWKYDDWIRNCWLGSQTILNFQILRFDNIFLEMRNTGPKTNQFNYNNWSTVMNVSLKRILSSSGPDQARSTLDVSLVLSNSISIITTDGDIKSLKYEY